MEETKLPKYLTMRQFREHIIGWSDDTIRRRIHDEGMPAQKEGRQFIFETRLILDWLKRRGARAG